MVTDRQTETDLPGRKEGAFHGHATFALDDAVLQWRCPLKEIHSGVRAMYKERREEEEEEEGPAGGRRRRRRSEAAPTANYDATHGEIGTK